MEMPGEKFWKLSPTIKAGTPVKTAILNFLLSDTSLEKFDLVKYSSNLFNFF